MTTDTCDSCGKNWLEHLGTTGTCAMLQEAKKALQFYAELDNYKTTKGLIISNVNMEKGTRARTVLGRLK